MRLHTVWDHRGLNLLSYKYTYNTSPISLNKSPLLVGPEKVNLHLKLPFPSPERKCVGLKSSGNSLTLSSIVPKASADQYAAIHTTTGTTPVKGYSVPSVFLLFILLGRRRMRRRGGKRMRGIDGGEGGKRAREGKPKMILLYSCRSLC